MTRLGTTPLRRRTTWTLAGAAVLAVQLHADAQRVSLETLLDMGTRYELEFIERFSNVVAEEAYAQEITVPRRKQTLRSEVALVRYPGATQWLLFRDTFEVNGRSVRDGNRQEQLLKLFLEPPRNAMRRAAEISEASARFNLVNVGSINNPLIALVFLQPDYRRRFRFNLAGIEKSLGPTVRTVRFQEFQRPTILHANANNDLPTHGLLWIDEASGRVVKTQLRLGLGRTPPEIVTRYAFDEVLDTDVPVEMRDWYPDGTGEMRGVATYSKFRRFQVRTDEAVQQ